jgi:hypothetical protein
MFFENLNEFQKKAYQRGEEINKPAAILRRESLRWLAVKVILQDKRYALLGTDEAAISEDLESRGSSSFQSAPKTYLIALSRKVTTDIKMVSQMMSMIDKRAQWLADVPILCTGHYYEGTNVPEYFDYQVYDASLTKVIHNFEIDGNDARRWLFPRFITEDIPMSEEKLKLFADYFNIGEADKKQFLYDMMLKRIKVKESFREESVTWSSKFYKKKGTYILYNGLHYQVALPPEFNSITYEWEHLLVPRFPELELLEEPALSLTPQEKRIDDEEAAKKSKSEYKRATQDPDDVTKEFMRGMGDVSQEDKNDYKEATGYKD